MKVNSVDDILVPGVVANLFYNEGNINNCTLHIRAIVDVDYVVCRRWSPRKGWLYKVEHRDYFELLYDSGKLKDFRREALDEEMEGIYGSR